MAFTIPGCFSIATLPAVVFYLLTSPTDFVITITSSLLLLFLFLLSISGLGLSAFFIVRLRRIARTGLQSGLDTENEPNITIAIAIAVVLVYLPGIAWVLNFFD